MRVVLVSAIVLVVYQRKSLRIRLIGLLSLAILLSQVAIAAYACPAMGGKSDAASAGMAGMPCAQMMADEAPLDSRQPMLCMQHCQFGSVSQVVDQVPPLFVAVTALPPTLTVSVDDGVDGYLWSRAESERLRDRPPRLPHSVVYCCYRI